jgi:multidrug efflux pump subunit AcrB
LPHHIYNKESWHENDRDDSQNLLPRIDPGTWHARISCIFSPRPPLPTSLERPEVIVRPDAQRAAERGVSTQSIGDAVRIATSGDFDAQVARLNLDNRQVYIRVRIPDAAPSDVNTLDNLRVNGRGGVIPLSSIANISVESGPAQIDRYDRHRYVTVSADLGGMSLGAALAAAQALPSVKTMPSSVKLIQTGDAEIAGELASGFGLAILVGVLCVYCVLALLFKDFLQPVTILSAIPLSLGGAFIALLAAHSELDLPAMIGLVMLTSTALSLLVVPVVFTYVDGFERRISRLLRRHTPGPDGRDSRLVTLET